DTAISLYALGQGDVDQPDSILRATRWLLHKQVRESGDWQLKNGSPPGGWFFEFDNPLYPDVDDSAMVMMALRKAWKPGDSPEVDEAIQRGLRWVMGMQNIDGGWGSFDRDNHRDILTHVPFADFNAMIDPSTADIAGRVLEMLGTVSPREFHLRHPAVQRAIDYIRKEQCEDGSWYGRWGCNYIYGTWQVLRGLRIIGENMAQPYLRKAVSWLARCQNRDGGWGEQPDSYDDPSRKGRGPSTPSQSAWALMGLLAAGEHGSEPARKAVDYLLETQLPDGTW
ncbi:MAG: squalene--hopene cyclase, partial [Syntrophobacteraceae bacterium]|nr:squalene--hopene cyclase [Syntrophobacteraceae bacterium]